MAYRGYGVWSLVAQSITNNFFRTILLWFFLPWRPSWIFSNVSLRSMFFFGSKLLFSGAVGYDLQQSVPRRYREDVFGYDVGLLHSSGTGRAVSVGICPRPLTSHLPYSPRCKMTRID